MTNARQGIACRCVSSRDSGPNCSNIFVAGAPENSRESSQRASRTARSCVTSVLAKSDSARRRTHSQARAPAAFAWCTAAHVGFEICPLATRAARATRRIASATPAYPKSGSQNAAYVGLRRTRRRRQRRVLVQIRPASNQDKPCASRTSRSWQLVASINLGANSSAYSWLTSPKGWSTLSGDGSEQLGSGGNFCMPVRRSCYRVPEGRFDQRGSTCCST